MLVARLLRSLSRRGFLSRARCCCGAGTRFCASCGGSWAPIAGATIAVLTGGGAPVASCVTDAAGCCTMGVATGNYTVRVTDADGRLIYGASRSVTAGTPVSIVPSCCATIRVGLCDGTPANCGGITVTIKSGATTLFTGTLDASGQVYPILPSSGPYTVEIGGTIPAGYASSTGSYTLTCGATTTIGLAYAAGYGGSGQCCGGAIGPDVFTLTDGNGSHSFAASSSGGIWQYSCCYDISLSGSKDAACDPGISPTPQMNGIFYVGTCTSGVFTVSRAWRSFKTTNPLSPGLAYSGMTCGAAFCTCSPATGCGGGSCLAGGGDCANVAFTIAGCGGFGPLSGTPVADTNNYMADPVGGSISLS